MTIWLIEPRDPLIVRDGRPFGPDPGARAKSLVFPFPSTIAGGVRTRAGQNPTTGEFDKSKIEAVLNVSIRGPLLVKIDIEKDMIRDWFLPAPADHVIFALTEDDKIPDTFENEDIERKELGDLRQLVPVEVSSDIRMTPYPNKHLLPVGFVERPSALKKPRKQNPAYWHWDVFAQWLASPGDAVLKIKELGVMGTTEQVRTHVRITPESQTAEEGFLFQTSGREFAEAGDRKRKGWLAEMQTYGLAVDVQLPVNRGLEVQPGIGALGGERRLVRWSEPTSSVVSIWQCPDEIRQDIMKHRACRLVLATPAYFAKGIYPTDFIHQSEVLGVKVEIRAIATPRAQVVSGWDFRTDSPKPTRRLTAAGTVFWLDLTKTTDATAIEGWIDALWMNAISDGGQEQRDGFGIATLGVW